MIKPTKHMNLELSVVHVASKLIEVLLSGPRKYQELLADLVIDLGEDSKFSFIPSLCFLFLLGKLEYDKETDKFRLIK